MFATHSIDPQLKPDTILKCVQGAEDHQWSLGDLTTGPDGSPQDGQDLGSLLLRQSICLKKVHSFFSQLESRKCCLHLACRRSTYNLMRVVPTSSLEDDGGYRQRQFTSGVSYLDSKNLRAFRNAYICAMYPVLAAPEPPITPSPAFLDSRLKSDDSSISSGSSLTNLYHSTPSYITSSRWNISPHDSGVEEVDEAAIIPMETVCEQLQRAFDLSKTLFHQYQSHLVKTYSKKSPQRLLAEELSGQLILLETNGHPYYSPKHFLSPAGYELWQKQERSHISELLNKFWQSSLPFPSNNKELIANLSGIHEDYHTLLKKLLEYESQFRLDHQVITADVYIPLSSASCRLLLEFALRYGIGELYRKVILLHCLTSEFSPSVGYLSYINGLMTGVLQMLPANKSLVVMVTEELSILSSSLQVIKVQSCKALGQMKFLFEENHPAEGIDSLLSVLHTVILLRQYLTAPDCPRETLAGCVTNTVQSMFQRSYDMFKIVALKDLERCSTGDFDPRLLNAVMEDIQEDVVGFKNNFESCFLQFFSISKMAAKSFYQFLMKDVEKLVEHHCLSQLQHANQIDVQMLGLVYRLNKLDTLWRSYIPPQQQVWRGYFLPCYFHWLDALQKHLQDIVLESVAGDNYKSQRFEMAHPLFTYQKSSASSDRKSCTFSVVSFSPSVNSAFSSFVSSVGSTPRQSTCSCQREDKSTITCSGPEQMCEDADVSSEPETKHLYDSISLNMEVNQTKDLMKVPITSCRSLPDNLHLLSHMTESFEPLKAGQGCSVELSDLLDFRGSDKLKLSRDLNLDATRSFIHLDDQELPSDEEGHTDPELDRTVSDDFQFPPVKMVPKEGAQDILNCANLLQPVFSMSASQETLCPPISAEASQSRVCSQGSRVQLSPTGVPVIFNTLMPVSGSVMDLMIAFQRLCGLSAVLASTLAGDLPATPVSVEQVEEHPKYCPDEPNITGHNGPTNEEINREDLTEFQLLQLQHSSLKFKFITHLRVLKSICHLLSIYSINLLSMDLCATRRSMAKKLIGQKLLATVDQLRDLRLIRMCRHEVGTTNGCLYYLSRQAAWIDRHEPLSQQMCTRINNVSACLDILEEFQQKLMSLLGLNDVVIHPVSSCPQENFFGSKVQPEFWPGSADEEDDLQEILTGNISQIQDYWAQVSRQMVEQTHQHLMLVLTGQCRLLAYRLNLFIKDGLEAHLGRWSANMTLSSCLGPVTRFLQTNLDSFSSWLYEVNFHRVLENIWIFVVQDFESISSQLVKTGPSSSALAHVWMLAVIHFMKFINNNGKGINRDLLLSQANHVMLELELHTLSTLHLVTLFQSLSELQVADGDTLTLEENASKRPPAITHKILRELQYLRKSFSGAELLHWIMKNQNVLPPDMDIPAETLTKTTAQSICQSLLDQNFIVELSSEASTRMTTPVSFGQAADFSPYPELSIHSSISVHNNLLFDDFRDRSSTLATVHEFHTVKEEAAEIPDVVQGTFFFGASKFASNFSSKMSGNTHKNMDGRRPRTSTNSSSHPSRQEEPKYSSDPAGADHLLTDHHLDADLANDLDTPTPFSSLTNIAALSGNRWFVANSSTFYLVRQSIFLPSTGSANRPSESTVTELDHLVNKLKVSSENLALVERCFIHKISPVFILSIVATRKKIDRIAREFMKQVPRSAVDKVRTLLDEPSLDCASS